MATTLPTIDLSDPNRENTAKKLIKAMDSDSRGIIKIRI